MPRLQYGHMVHNEPCQEKRFIMSHMDARAVLARAKQALDVKTDRELADCIGVPRETVVSWKRRGSIPAKHLSAMTAYRISLDWLLTGKGHPGDTGEFGLDEKGNEKGQFTLDAEVLWVALNVILRELEISPDEYDKELARALSKKSLFSLNLFLEKNYPRVVQSKERWLNSGLVKEKDVYMALLTEYALIEWNSAFVLPPWWDDPEII